MHMIDGTQRNVKICENLIFNLKEISHGTRRRVILILILEENNTFRGQEMSTKREV